MVIIDSLVGMFILMTLVWLLYLRLQKPFVVDIAWSIMIGSAGLFFALNHPLTLYSLCCLALLFFWSIRLFLYLFITRIINTVNDTRYDAISQSWNDKKSRGFLWHYQLQGLLALSIALPFYWIPQVDHFTTLRVCVLVLTFLMIVGEWVADHQLHRFKQSHSGQVCQSGLWAWSRHPNCFFEAKIWIGFFLLAITSNNPWSLVAVASPLVIHWIMLGITIPITEKKSLQSRGDAYQAYIKTTPCFYPWSKKGTEKP